MKKLSTLIALSLTGLALAFTAPVSFAQNAAPFLQVMRERLLQEQWFVAPPAIVRQGRVAVGDEVGELLGAKMVVVLIGERPGLSSPDSMGLYVTWAPRVGLTDERRNCIANVRPAGQRYGEAAGSERGSG